MKEQLIEALKQLGRGRIDAAEVIAELLMPEKVKSPAEAYAVELPATLGRLDTTYDKDGEPGALTYTPPKKKAK